MVKDGTKSSSSRRFSLGKDEVATSSTGIHYKKSMPKKRTKDEIEEFKSEYSTNAHILSLQELQELFETDLELGLTQDRADALLVENGPNALVISPPRSKVWLLLEFLFGGFAALLWVGAVLSIIGFAFNYVHDKDTGNINHSTFDQLCLGVVIMVVILVTGFFGFYQEAKNAAILDSFTKMSPKQATVIRDGERKVIPCEEIVLGDLVILEMGLWIPADLRLIEAQGLKVDNSAITGESLPQSRSTDLTHNNPIETANLAFYTCCVVEGCGRGIAINCGENTLLGHIAGLTSALQKGQTPIRREINHFIKIITVIAVLTGVTFFIVSMCVGFNFFQSFSFFIALVVANVPEGLPVTMTACMTLTAKRMAKKNCLVKKLEAIETLGCCNVICSDKTGTLTQNKMTVTHVYYGGVLHHVLHDMDSVEANEEDFHSLERGAALCSRATFVEGEENKPVDKRKVHGDASESAILKFMEKATGGVELVRKEFPKVAEIPFNSANKYQVSVHEMQDKRYLVLMKGAPERVLENCSTYLHHKITQEFDADKLKIAKKAVTNLGTKGERVLAFADLELDEEEFPPGFSFNVDSLNFPLKGLRFVGLISMIDPPRPSVPDAVSKCRSAGIRVIMVTGDHPVTAAAIAKQVGILSSDSITMYDIALRRDVSISLVTEQEKAACTAAVITGQDLRDMAEGQLESTIMQFGEIVFARTSPQQKLKIVEAFQKSGLVVAVTGDGVNDSPALKKADIGIAMGITGSDVSKEAADMILMDDNFSSIVTGIEEGRLIFDNLKKSIAYLLTSNLPEILPFIAMTFFNTPPVCSVMAVIIIDVGTDLWPAISLAYEKAEADIMLRKPRNPKYDRLVNNRLIFLTYAQIGVIQSFASFAAYCHIMTSAGFLWYNLGSRRMDWLDEKVLIVTDDFGREWNYEERMKLSRKAYSAYFLAIVLTQIFDLFICKTRRLSLFQQGMTNWVMNLGVVFEIALGLFVVYCPTIQKIFQFESIQMHHILPALPYAVMILVFDELRKLCIRKFPSGVVYKETYY